MEKTSLNGMKGHDRERKQVLFMKMRKKNEHFLICISQGHVSRIDL